MNYVYTYNLSDFPNNKVALDRLTLEIRNSSIAVALDYINLENAIVGIYFKAELSLEEKTTLDGIVAAHSGLGLPSAPQLIQADIITENIKFVEAGDTTQGLFAAKSLIIDISAGASEKIVDFTWPFDIALLSGTLGISEDMIGDDFMVDVGPNTLIGALIAPLNVGDTSAYVSPTVLQNIKRGFYFGLYSGGEVTGVEISQVKTIDSANSCLGLVTPSDVSANAGSLVAMCAKIIPELYLHSIEKVEIGKDITTGQRIPAGLPVRVHYHNNNLVAKKISFFIEYLY